MDVQATEKAIKLLEDAAAKWEGLFEPSTVGKAVLESAAYRLRVQLREYLTRGRK